MPLWLKDSAALSLFLCSVLLITFLFQGFSPVLNSWQYQYMRWQYQRQQSKLLTQMTITETAHFTYAHSTLSPESLALIQEESEHIYAAVNAFFAYTPTDKIPVMIFPSGEALNDRFGWEGDRSPMGVYWLGYINILAPEGWIRGSTTARAQIFRRMGPMAHEYSHLIIDDETHGNYPRWFSEGCAQYVEQSLGYFTTTMPQAADQKFVPFSELEKRFDDALWQNQAYWQSLETVTYLTAHFGEDIIMRLIHRLGQGESMDTALRALTGHSSRTLLTALAEEQAAA